MKKIQIRLMKMNEKRGWSGMLGSVDCTYWRWKNFPKAWPRKNCGKNHDPNIVLMVVSSMTCGFGNVFYGFLMSTNASILVDSVGPPSAEVCRTAASFP
jgi:hypothetical protein